MSGVIEISMHDRIEEWHKANFARMVIINTYRLGTKQIAEDVIQETYYRCLKYANSFDSSEKKFDQWFGTVFHKTMSGIMRKERRMGMTVEYNEELDEPFILQDWQEDMIDRLKREIGNKREPARSICYLYFLREYKPKEIECVVDANFSAITSCINFFKKQMRAKYGKEAGKSLRI